jgi:hypothetical protein
VDATDRVGFLSFRFVSRLEGQVGEKKVRTRRGGKRKGRREEKRRRRREVKGPGRREEKS